MTQGLLDEDEVAALETPVVVVDLDRTDSRIAAMAATMRDRGIALRPHAKTHKSVEIARRQVAAGAAGLTVATIGEAEVFADAGLTDLFIAYPVIARGPRADRLRRLASRSTLSVGADSVDRARRAGGGAGGRGDSVRVRDRDRHAAGRERASGRGRRCAGSARGGPRARGSRGRSPTRVTATGAGPCGAAAGDDAADGLAVAAAAMREVGRASRPSLSAGLDTDRGAVRPRRRDRGAARHVRLRRPSPGGDRRSDPPRTRP